MEEEKYQDINLQALVHYSESSKKNSHANPDYEKIKSYLFLINSTNEEQKEIAKRFLDKEKNKENFIRCLNQIANDPEEQNDLRLIVTQLMSKFYGINNSLLKKFHETEGILTSIHSNAKFNHLIDALPYIDASLDDPRYREESKKLIQEEMKKSKKNLNEYINLIPEVKITQSEFFQQEIKRIENNQKSSFTSQAIQTTFEEPAPNKIHDLDSWNSLMKKVNLSLSHLNIKNLNLDLFIKFSPSLWKKYLFTFDSILKQLENEAQELQEKCEEINKERKLKQVFIFFYKKF
jgi:hypothetical protein